MLHASFSRRQMSLSFSSIVFHPFVLSIFLLSPRPLSANPTTPAPSIVITPIGGVARLPCGLDPPDFWSSSFSLFWFKENVTLPILVDAPRRFQSGVDARFRGRARRGIGFDAVIEDVRPSDAGRFRCHALMDGLPMSRTERWVELRVEGTEPTPDSINVVDAFVGGAVTLPCGVDSPPASLSNVVLKWEKKYAESPILLAYGAYPPHVDERFQGRASRVSSGFDLRVESVRSGDGGRYRCVVLSVDSGESITGEWVVLDVVLDVETTNRGTTRKKRTTNNFGCSGFFFFGFCVPKFDGYFTTV